MTLNERLTIEARIMKSEDDAEKIARKFAEGLTEDLGAGTVAEIVRLNATPAYAGCCASHDFCDANMVMADAFEEVLGHALDAGDETHAALVNRAWDLAKNAGFDPKAIQYAPILERAVADLDALPDLEPRSALKQAASDAGITYGPTMGEFVQWAEARLYGGTAR